MKVKKTKGWEKIRIQRESVIPFCLKSVPGGCVTATMGQEEFRDTFYICNFLIVRGDVGLEFFFFGRGGEEFLQNFN